jgi:hypothetical protein
MREQVLDHTISLNYSIYLKKPILNRNLSLTDAGSKSCGLSTPQRQVKTADVVAKRIVPELFGESDDEEEFLAGPSLYKSVFVEDEMNSNDEEDAEGYALLGQSKTTLPKSHRQRRRRPSQSSAQQDRMHIN